MPPEPVTAVIPTHRRPELLAEALESVLAQTTPPAEIIVVDDAADAPTRDVVGAHAGAPIRMIVEEHGRGVARSRNLGLTATATPLVAFLDDDDRWHPRFLEATSAALVDPGAQLAVTWQANVSAATRWDGAAMPAAVTARDAAVVNPGFTGSNVLYRVDALRAIDGFDEDLWVSNDKDLLVRLLLAGSEYAVVPERLVDRRLDSGAQRLGTSSSRRIEGLEHYIAKHQSLLSPRDVRFLRGRIERVRRRAAASTGARLVHTAKMLTLLGPSGVARVRADDARTQPPA